MTNTTLTLEEKQADLALFQLALKLAKVPASAAKTVQGLLNRLFEAIQTGNEKLEVARVSELKALHLVGTKASHEMGAEIVALRAQRKKLHEQIVALERECKELEQEAAADYQHFQRHEAAAVAEEDRHHAQDIFKKLQQ